MYIHLLCLFSLFYHLITIEEVSEIANIYPKKIRNNENKQNKWICTVIFRRKNCRINGFTIHWQQRIPVSITITYTFTLTTNGS